MALIQSNQAKKTDFSANGQTLELDVATSGLARVDFSGTYAFTAAFESTVDGTTWFPVLGTKTDAATTSLNHSTANATQAYTVDCRVAAKVRVKLTAFTSAGTHKVLLSASNY